MSDCVEGGRGDDSRGVGAVKASQGASVDCVVGVGVGNIRC